MPSLAAALPLAASSDVKMCGCTLRLQGRKRFVALTVAAIASAVAFAALQESVTHVEGFNYYGYMTLLTQATMCACGQLERLLSGDRVRVGPLAQYFVLSLLTLSGALFTNWSLSYLSYPTRVLFKSSKLLPTMAVGTLMQGRRYSVTEYVAALGLVTGIILFTMGDSDSRPTFALKGVGLILVGVFADAATSNYEEKQFFRVPSPASQPEVITYANVFGSFWELLMLLLPHLYAISRGEAAEPVEDELAEAIAHTAAHPEVLVKLVISAICGYVSVSFVLLLIKLYGASVTEMVKSLRKVITVVLSFVLHPNAVTPKHALGGLFVLLSLAATHELQRRKGGDVPADTTHLPSEMEASAISLGEMEEAPLAENTSEDGDGEGRKLACHVTSNLPTKQPHVTSHALLPSDAQRS